MKTIDVYARVSRASDKRMRSPAGQIAECKTVLADKGLALGEVFMDPSKSAWNTKVFRPGWETLMRRLESGETDGVIIYELTRFTRRSEEGMRLLRAAKNGLVVLDSEREHDLSTGEGRRIFRDAISAAEAESDKISMRTKRGKLTKVRDNAEFNVAQRPFGFESDSIALRENEAKELRAAAKKLLAGTSALEICADLNARGVRTTFGNLWKPPSLKAALVRPANVGDVSHLGVIVHTARYPGLLDRDTFDQVRALYAGRRRGRPIANLATGFVQCSKCRRPLNAKPLYRSTITNPDGTAIKTYACVRGTGGCGLQIDWYDLNSYLKKLALAILCDPAHEQVIEEQATAAQSVHAELAAVRAKIAELTTTANTVAARWGSGQITQERHDATMGPLDEQLAKLESRKVALIKSMPARVAKARLESRATWERRWKGADITGQREIVRQALAGRILLVSPGARLDPARDRCRFSVESRGKAAS